MSGRNAQVSRIYRILNILEGAPQGLSISEIWNRVRDRGHECTKRTVYRDLEALEAAGFPLTQDGESENAGRWTLGRSARITRYFVLSARELLALYLSREALTPLKETPFYADLETVFTKIEDHLGPAHREYLRDLSSEIYFEPLPKWGLGLDPELMATVHAGCSERHVLTIEYASASGNNKRLRRVGPHYLYFAKGSVYLVAEDLEEGRMKTFAVPRMSHAEMTGESYDTEPVSPEKFFEYSFGIFQGHAPSQIKLLASGKIAPYLKERRWHDSQRFTALPSGQLELVLNVAATPELLQWILGFGPDMTVLEPESLRAEIVAAAQATLDQYKKRAA